MSTMREQFEAWAAEEGYPESSFEISNDGDVRTYYDTTTEAMWDSWQAATEAAKAEPAEYKGWYCAHCQRGVDASEVTFHEQHTVCGRVITDDCPPSAKATGTAGELPPLPDSDWVLQGSANNRDAYTADQMREYGQACAEAARQPAPVVLSDDQIEELARKHNLDGSMLNGSRMDDYVLPFARAVIAATNRSQPEKFTARAGEDIRHGQRCVLNHEGKLIEDRSQP